MTEDEARELLPWYATGTLEPAEAREVENWLQRSAALEGELRELRLLREHLRETTDPVSSSRADPIEPVLRLIEAHEASRTRARRRPSVARSYRLPPVICES